MAGWKWPWVAAASDTLKGYDDALAKDCLETAIKAWNDEKAHPTPMPTRGFGAPAPAGAPASSPTGGVLAASQGVVSGAPAASGTTTAPTTAPQAPPAPPAGFALSRVLL
jgi:endoglucanase